MPRLKQFFNLLLSFIHRPWCEHLPHITSAPRSVLLGTPTVLCGFAPLITLVPIRFAGTCLQKEPGGCSCLRPGRSPGGAGFGARPGPCVP